MYHVVFVKRTFQAGIRIVKICTRNIIPMNNRATANRLLEELNEQRKRKWEKTVESKYVIHSSHKAWSKRVKKKIMSQNIRKAIVSPNIFVRFCFNHKPSYSNCFLPTRKQRNTNTVENKSNFFNTTICL
jgi:hypothetical protein